MNELNYDDIMLIKTALNFVIAYCGERRISGEMKDEKEFEMMKAYINLKLKLDKFFR